MDESLLLYMMLSRNGSLNRRGEGSEDPSTLYMAMGHTDDPIFTDLLAQLPDDWLEHTGRYTMPDRQGKTMLLTISIQNDQVETGFQFTYGSDSVGPPEDMIEFLELALDLTDPWYEEATQKQRRKR